MVYNRFERHGLLQKSPDTCYDITLLIMYIPSNSICVNVAHIFENNISMGIIKYLLTIFCGTDLKRSIVQYSKYFVYGNSFCFN